MCLPIASASPTGTALPICLYWLAMLPLNTQSDGNCCMAAYSATDSGRTLSGWHSGVAFCAGLVSSVGQGLSQGILR